MQVAVRRVQWRVRSVIVTLSMLGLCDPGTASNSPTLLDPA